MARFILVPGGWHGGWAFDAVRERLAGAGHAVQAIRLTGDWRKVRGKTYVAAFGWEGSPFIALHERLRQDPGWATHALDCAHDIPRLAPEALAKILLGGA